MNIYTNKQRVIISTVTLILLLIFILTNYTAFFMEDSFNTISFVLSIIACIISCILFAIKIESNNKFNELLTMLSFILSIIFSYIIVELLNQNIPFLLYSKRLIFNFIIIIFLHLFIYAISNKVSLSILLSNLIIFILGAVNYTVTCFRGTPLVPWDILSIKTAAYVAGSYSFSLSYYFILATSLLSLILSIGLKINYQFKNKKLNLVFRFIILLIILFFTIVFYKTNIITYFDFENNLWRPMDEYSNNGFLASFVKQSKNLFNEEPENYSIQEIKNILHEFETENTIPKNISSNDKPNIIVIMSESYCDLSVNR